MTEPDRQPPQGPGPQRPSRPRRNAPLLLLVLGLIAIVGLSVFGSLLIEPGELHGSQQQERSRPPGSSHNRTISVPAMVRMTFAKAYAPV